MKKIKQYLTILDQQLLLWLAGFLVIFIPLYPKIPLFSPLETYIVRVRLEDLAIAGTVFLWLIQYWRHKVTIHPKLTKLIGLYLLVSFLSVLSGIFITKTIPLIPIHVGKSLLHFCRYFEYFSLFFILYSVVKTKREVVKLLTLLVVTLAGVVIYGWGQRYLYWPVYSTMNREFSKGITLYLTEHARVQSTFAGHYDLGAWLVIILPLVLALAFSAKKKLLKVALHLFHLGGLWLLIESAARSSFIGYVVAVELVVILFASQQARWWKKLWYFFSRSLFLSLGVIIVMIYFGDSMIERIVQALEPFPILAQSYHTFEQARTKVFDQTLDKISLSLFPQVNKPENGLSTDEAVQILVSSDERPVTEKPKNKPSDVYVDVPEYVQVATVSATGENAIVTIAKERDYSANAIKYGLSFAIRLDTLWPQAIKGFTTNPFLGTGYATLNKNVVFLFTEADGSDNNYLRTLGETGGLGFLTFYGIILAGIALAIKAIRKNYEPLLTTLASAYLAGSIGLLLNAAYIDVYASSKVAYTYWAMTGIFLAYYNLAAKHARLSGNFFQKKPTGDRKLAKATKQKIFTNSIEPKHRRRRVK